MSELSNESRIYSELKLSTHQILRPLGPGTAPRKDNANLSLTSQRPFPQLAFLQLLASQYPVTGYIHVRTSESFHTTCAVLEMLTNFERCGARVKAAQSAVHPSMRSVQSERETLRGKKEREGEGGTDGSKTQPN